MQAQNKYNADCTKAYAQLLANIAREIVQFSQDFNMPIFPDDVAGLVHGFGDHLGAHFEEHFSGDDFDNAWSWAASTVNAAIKDECEAITIGMLKPTVHYDKGEKVCMPRRYAEQYLRACYAYYADDDYVNTLRPVPFNHNTVKQLQALVVPTVTDLLDHLGIETSENGAVV